MKRYAIKNKIYKFEHFFCLFNLSNTIDKVKKKDINEILESENIPEQLIKTVYAVSSSDIRELYLSKF